MLIINGRKIDSDQSPSLIFDEGVAFGRGAFETLPVFEQPLWLDAHVERLNRTLPQLGIMRPVAATEILDLIPRKRDPEPDLEDHRHAAELVLVTRLCLCLPRKACICCSIRKAIHSGAPWPV